MWKFSIGGVLGYAKYTWLECLLVVGPIFLCSAFPRLPSEWSIFGSLVFAHQVWQVLCWTR